MDAEELPELPGWLELVEELLPGFEEEVPPLFPPPQEARDRTMAADSTAAKIRLFMISKTPFLLGLYFDPFLGSVGFDAGGQKRFPLRKNFLRDYYTVFFRRWQETKNLESPP